MKNIFVLSFLLMLFAVTSCKFYGVRGSGDVITEERDIEEFSSLSVGGIFEVEITNGEEPSLVIEAEDNLIDLIRTSVHGDHLEIDTRKHISPRKALKLKITTFELRNIDISGACNVKVYEINSSKFSVDASGASNVYLEGTSGNLLIDISGASNVNAADLVAEKVSADLSGASNADVYASENLYADLSGASHIDYYGDPQNIKYDCSGASSLNRK